MNKPWVVVVLVGCAAGEDEEVDPVDQDPCEGAVMEEDFAVDDGLGPAGDPANWGPLPPDAIVSTTYLQLRDTAEAQQAFDEASAPIPATLESSPGLMGLAFAGSESCGVVRTLTVWATEEAMVGFVTSDAHAAAMGRIGEISRGGSMTMSWTVEELGAPTWERIIEALGEHEGPHL